MKSCLFYVALLVAIIVVSVPVLFAADPASRAAGTRPAAPPLTEQEQQFVNQAWYMNATEIRLGAIAQERATNADVKAFGKLMVDDHTVLEQELTAIAAERHISLPSAIDKSHQQLIDRLEQLAGADFDRQYMSAMIDDHQEAIPAFAQQAMAEPQTLVKLWASTAALPTLKHHLAVALKTGAGAK